MVCGLLLLFLLLLTTTAYEFVTTGDLNLYLKTKQYKQSNERNVQRCYKQTKVLLVLQNISYFYLNYYGFRLLYLKHSMYSIKLVIHPSPWHRMYENKLFLRGLLCISLTFYVLDM